MPATLIDGKALAATRRTKIKQIVGRMARRPRLATLLVGDDPASQIYVNNKIKACGEVGIAVHMEKHTAAVSTTSLTAAIDKLNADPTIHGILLQLPLPKTLDTSAIVSRLDPRKDVDGLHPHNAGLLAQGNLSGFIPCTPRGCLQLIKSITPHLFAKQALVIGRSLLVGRPMASLLLAHDCTVTIAHSKSHDVPSLASQADIIVAAAGSPDLVRRDWVKPGAIIIDVGISRVDGKVRGDVAAEVRDLECHITPVPGGVGPMTIANLLGNTVIACCRQSNLPIPEELVA